MNRPNRNPAVPSAREASPPAAEETVSARGSPESAHSPSFAPGGACGLSRLGKYRLLGELGRGGMGVVYLAHDERLQREVALKVLLPNAAADGNARERFLREARAAARISSDHVVSIYEAEEIEGTPYIAMQHLAGCSLAQHIKGGKALDIAEVLRIGRETALGLAAAHRLGLVHRDVKPSNLWLESPSGRVKILDFGLVRPVVEGSGAEITGSGVVVGTPAYLAPEQGMAKPIDGRADLFSLGCVLYRLCTGKLAFDRPTEMATLAAIATEEPTPVRAENAAVPEALAELIRRLMAKRAEDRPADASVVADELARIAVGAPDKPDQGITSDYIPAVGVPASTGLSRPRRRVTLVLLVALILLPLLALGAWFMTRPGLAPVLPPEGPMKGSVDLLVHRIDDKGSDVLVPLGHSLAMPLRTGDHFEIVAEVDRPAYLYLFWIDENGVGVPVYPWKPSEWGTRPTDERPVTTLNLVAPNGKGFQITGDVNGMETIVMLARASKLEASDAEVQGWFAGLKPLPFRGPQARVWFENFDVLRDDAKRGFEIVGDVDTVDGPRGLQLALKQKVGTVELARAISFARVGPSK